MVQIHMKPSMIPKGSMYFFLGAVGMSVVDVADVIIREVIVW